MKRDFAEIEFSVPGNRGTVTDVIETVQKHTLKPASCCQLHSWLYLCVLLHESLGTKHIYTVEKAEEQ
jgi:hypothetical protein